MRAEFGSMMIARAELARSSADFCNENLRWKLFDAPVLDVM